MLCLGRYGHNLRGACAALDFRERDHVQVTIGTPVTAMESDDHRSVAEERFHADQAPFLVGQQEGGKALARLRRVLAGTRALEPRDERVRGFGKVREAIADNLGDDAKAFAKRSLACSRTIVSSAYFGWPGKCHALSYHLSFSTGQALATTDFTQLSNSSSSIRWR